MKTFVRRATTLAASLALVAVSALVTTPAASADTVEPTLGTPKISGLARTVVPSASGTRTFTFNLSVVGSPDDGGYSDVNGDGVGVYYGGGWAEVVKVSSRVAKPIGAYVSRVGSVTTGKPVKYKLELAKFASPGRYEIRVPVKQYYKLNGQYLERQVIGRFRFDVRANTNISKANTYFSAPSWKPGATATFTVRAPEYQRTAKVALFVKKKGKKSYTRVALTTLGKASYGSVVKIKAKNLRVGDRIYFKVGSVSYAPGYSLSSVLIKRV
ncbi:hypothetical protein [Sanguibacter sp. HDW7]|uniref:hypothetical protein n=1 Tax=Sanguibacter sp. HDW7 TaxID=2714931 RepID=UPI00140C6950|nr:hypothetical protein [Sanguibacter sp. HDW7]QIK83936.1 hypothetical protein G7063_10110 [Sanguibacter sp. HDW7]